MRKACSAGQRGAAQRSAARRSAPSRGPCRPRGRRSAREGWGGSLAGQAGGCTQERERLLVWRGQQEQEGGRRPLKAAAQQSRRAGQPQSPSNRVHRSRTALAGACRSCTALAYWQQLQQQRSACHPPVYTTWQGWVCRYETHCANWKALGRVALRSGKAARGEGRNQAWAKGRRPAAPKTADRGVSWQDGRQARRKAPGLQASPPRDSPAASARTDSIRAATNKQDGSPEEDHAAVLGHEDDGLLPDLRGDRGAPGSNRKTRQDKMSKTVHACGRCGRLSKLLPPATRARAGKEGHKKQGRLLRCLTAVRAQHERSLSTA